MATVILYLHRYCGHPAVETSDAGLPELPSGFPFPCLYCLDEIGEDDSELLVIEQMGQ